MIKVAQIVINAMLNVTFQNSPPNFLIIHLILRLTSDRLFKEVVSQTVVMVIDYLYWLRRFFAHLVKDYVHNIELYFIIVFLFIITLFENITDALTIRSV